MDRVKESQLEKEGKICCECGNKKVIQIVQGRFRKYGYCKEHSNPEWPADIR